MHSRIEELKYEKCFLESESPSVDDVIDYLKYLNNKYRTKQLARINKEIEDYKPTLAEAIEQYKEENDD